MKNPSRPRRLEPLLLGRVGRVLFGLGTLAAAVGVGSASLTLWGTVGLVFLGVSFLVGGIVGNPGCEVTALPNLFLPQHQKKHCW